MQHRASVDVVHLHDVGKRAVDEGRRLKGIDNGIMDEAPVEIFVMGENRWRAEAEFPLKRATSRELFLR
ncbi:MAG: hypothetical protein ACRD1Z_15765, partial [Vicinamibacteria bacterium]